MAYSVIGGDGKEYGPVEADQLKTWLAEGRLTANSQVKDFLNGRVSNLSDIPGVVDPIAAGAYSAPPPPNFASYPRPGYVPAGPKKEPTGLLVGVLVRCAIALMLAFFFKLGGVVTSAYALYYAIKAKTSHDSKWGVPAIILASVTLAIVLLIVMLRAGSMVITGGQPG